MTNADKNRKTIHGTAANRGDNQAITPNLQKRLEELLADSPLNDEPLTPEQAKAVDHLMGRRPKASRLRREDKCETKAA